MTTIKRTGIKAEYVAPESVPAFSRRWQRAMSALNAADDQRHLMDATAQDDAEARATFEGKLVELERGTYHANLARLTSRRAVAVVAPDYSEPTCGSIVTNGPNTEPTARITNAVGHEVAA